MVECEIIERFQKQMSGSSPVGNCETLTVMVDKKQVQHIYGLNSWSMLRLIWGSNYLRPTSAGRRPSGRNPASPCSGSCALITETKAAKATATNKKTLKMLSILDLILTFWFDLTLCFRSLVRYWCFLQHSELLL